MATKTKRLSVSLNRHGLTIRNLVFNEFPVHMTLKEYFSIISRFDHLEQDYRIRIHTNSMDPVSIDARGVRVLYLELSEMEEFLEQLAEESYKLASGCDLDPEVSIAILSKVLPYRNRKNISFPNNSNVEQFYNKP